MEGPSTCVSRLFNSISPAPSSFLDLGSVFVKHLVFASFIPTHSVSWVNHFPLLMGYDGLISLLCGFWWTPLLSGWRYFQVPRFEGDRKQASAWRWRAPSSWKVMLDHHPNLGEQIIYIYISLCGQRPYPQYGGSGGAGWPYSSYVCTVYIYIIIYIYIYEEWYLNTWNHQRVSDLGQKTSGQQKTGFIGTDWFGIQSMVDSAPT